MLLRFVCRDVRLEKNMGVLWWLELGNYPDYVKTAFGGLLALLGGGIGVFAATLVVVLLFGVAAMIAAPFESRHYRLHFDD